MKKFKIGFIGSGRIVGHHLKAIKKNKNFTPKAICDLIIKKTDIYSKKYNLNCYDHYDAMLQNEDLDVVAIVTPSGMHYEHAKKILKNYDVNLIVEKPTFLKTSQVEEVYKIAKNQKKKIFPVFQNRYNKAVKRLKSAIKKKEIGNLRIVNVRVRWCRPQRYYNLSKWRGTFSHDGGALTNQGIHHIDVLRYLFGEVKNVNCNMKTLGAKIEVEDTAMALIEFENGVVGTLEITTAARPKDYEASISVIGSKGLAQIGGLAINKLEIFSPKPSDTKKFSENIPDAYGFGHFDLYKDVALDLNRKKKFPVSFEDCYKTIQFLNSFYSSNEKKKTLDVKKVVDSKLLGKKNEKISKLYR